MLVDYKLPADLPGVIPVFPLSGALLLPRVLLPLNIFEPRYISMINDSMSSSRIIGIIQPRNGSKSGPYGLYDAGCVGRLTTYNETEDGRILVTLTGLCRFQVLEELDVTTAYRQVKADYEPFSHDLVKDYGVDDVDRTGLLEVLKNYLDANQLQGDWPSIEGSPTEELVNSLSVVSPYGPPEKQALLEADTLASRADMLIAMTEVVLAQGNDKETPLQ